MISKSVNNVTDTTCGLTSLQVWERVVMDTAAFMASRRKCMVKTLIGQKYCVRYLNIFYRSSSATNEPNQFQDCV